MSDDSSEMAAVGVGMSKEEKEEITGKLEDLQK